MTQSRHDLVTEIWPCDQSKSEPKIAIAEITKEEESFIIIVDGNQYWFNLAYFKIAYERCLKNE